MSTIKKLLAAYFLPIQIAFMGLVVVVIGLFLPRLAIFSFNSNRQAAYQQINNDVCQLGQQLAHKSLHLARPYMAISYKENVPFKIELWEKLQGRVERIYDFNRPWPTDKESPFEVLEIISREHALGIFYKNYPQSPLLEDGDIYEEAYKDSEWVWTAGVQNKIYDLWCLGRKVNDTNNQRELEEVQQEVESLKKEIRKIFIKGPPLN